MSRRIAVTGIGVETAIASGIENYKSALMSGVSGVDTINLFDASGYRTDQAAYIKELAAEKNNRGRIYTLLDNVCEQAIKDSKLDGIDGADVGVSIGSCLGNVDCLDLYYESQVNHKDVSPAIIMDQPHSMAASYIADKYGFYNIASVSDTACSSAANAIGFAIDRIRSGKAEVMVAGGVDPFSRLSQGGFGSLKNLTKEIVHPLSGDCNGIILGEGAGILVLEELEHAEKRGAKIYAEILGYGVGNDAYHDTKPDPKSGGAIRAFQECMNDAGIEASQVDYINAHGTGTKLNDTMELNAIREVFGDYAKSIPVSSIKPMIGHTLGTSGAVELIACILCIRDHFLPPTIQYENPMPGFEEMDVVPNKARQVEKIDLALSGTFAFGGNMVVLACKRFVK